MEIFARAETLLRGESDPAPQTRSASLLWSMGAAVACGAAYGALMGTFGGMTGDRLPQIVFSAFKVPVLFLVTFLLSLPSFFVLNTLFGLRIDFGQVLRALLSAQAGLTMILLSLAPFTLLWYASSADYPSAILFNAMIFGLSSLAAQRLLLRYYRPLLDRDSRHRLMLRLWIVLYAFVGIQMGWILRPFIGNPGEPARFFREDAWGNAYLVIIKLVGEKLF